MKYNQLLEGLEISVINWSEIRIDNEKFRIDNEFFKKKYLRSYSIIKSKDFLRFNDIISVLTDFHSNGSYESIAKVFELKDEKDYAYMVRTTDLEHNEYDENVKYVTEECYNYLSKSKVYGGELLINKIGSPGRTYLMPYLHKNVSLGMNLFLIRLNSLYDLNNEFLWAFFNSEMGKNIIGRKINGTVPLTIDKEAIRSLPIPTCSIIQEEIRKITRVS